MRRYSIGIICFIAILSSATSYAVQVSIDSFSISSSTLSFTDTFSNNGQPPPCGPNGCATQPTFYGVNGTIPSTAESGGFLQLNSSNGILGTNAGGGARINETVQVGGLQSQLYKSTAGSISMTGVFTLPTLSGPLNEGYGIRFIDALPGSGPGSNKEVLELNVQWWTGNASNPAGWYIRYLVQDFNSNTITTIDADIVNIPTGANEICLYLSSAGSNDFSASYAYVTGGTYGPQVSLGSATGFLYQNYVRGQFQAFETSVPEPGTLLLLASGLVGLWGFRKKLRK